MFRATSGDEPLGMNDIAYYRAEIDYRFGQMRRDRAAMRKWRQALKAAAPRNHAGQ